MEIISTNLTPVMYQTSIPQAGEGETGGDADAKQGGFFDEEWGTVDFKPWSNAYRPQFGHPDSTGRQIVGRETQKRSSVIFRRGTTDEKTRKTVVVLLR